MNMNGILPVENNTFDEGDDISSGIVASTHYRYMDDLKGKSKYSI